VKPCLNTPQLVLTLALASTGVHAQPTEHRGPPPEAVAACQGKSEGASVSLTLRGGETVTATCRKMGDTLAAWPDKGPGAPPPPPAR